MSIQGAPNLTSLPHVPFDVMARNLPIQDRTSLRKVARGTTKDRYYQQDKLAVSQRLNKIMQIAEVLDQQEHHEGMDNQIWSLVFDVYNINMTSPNLSPMDESSIYRGIQLMFALVPVDDFEQVFEDIENVLAMFYVHVVLRDIVGRAVNVNRNQDTAHFLFQCRFGPTVFAGENRCFPEIPAVDHVLIQRFINIVVSLFSALKKEDIIAFEDVSMFTNFVLNNIEERLSQEVFHATSYGLNLEQLANVIEQRAEDRMHGMVDEDEDNDDHMDIGGGARKKTVKRRKSAKPKSKSKTSKRSNRRKSKKARMSSKKSRSKKSRRH
jgi:hypothetical protein